MTISGLGNDMPSPGGNPLDLMETVRHLSICLSVVACSIVENGKPVFNINTYCPFGRKVLRNVKKDQSTRHFKETRAQAPVFGV